MKLKLYLHHVTTLSISSFFSVEKCRKCRTSTCEMVYHNSITQNSCSPPPEGSPDPGEERTAAWWIEVRRGRWPRFDTRPVKIEFWVSLAMCLQRNIVTCYNQGPHGAFLSFCLRKNNQEGTQFCLLLCDYHDEAKSHCSVVWFSNWPVNCLTKEC
jgi:hypothetical protein